jgi:hypothetical protein
MRYMGDAAGDAAIVTLFTGKPAAAPPPPSRVMSFGKRGVASAPIQINAPSLSKTPIVQMTRAATPIQGQATSSRAAVAASSRAPGGYAFEVQRPPIESAAAPVVVEAPRPDVVTVPAASSGPTALPPEPIPINSEAAKPKSIFDRGPVEKATVSVTADDWMWVVGGIAGAVAIGVGAFFALRKGKR